MTNQKEEFRIVERKGIKYKVKYWDDLTFEQYKIVSSTHICLFGMSFLPLWKRRDYLDKVFKAQLEDYVIGIKQETSK